MYIGPCRLDPLPENLGADAARRTVKVHGEIGVEGAAEPVFLGFLARALLLSLLENLRAVREYGVRLRLRVALFRDEEFGPCLFPVLPRQELYPAVMDVDDDTALHGLADDAAQKCGGAAPVHDLRAFVGNSYEKLCFGVVDFGHSYPVELAIIADYLVRFHNFAVFAVWIPPGKMFRGRA